MSPEPIASPSLDGWSQDAPGWWRNGVNYQLLGSNPGVGEKLPPQPAGWFLLEVAR